MIVKSNKIKKTISKKITTALFKDKFIKNFINSIKHLEVPEGFEPSTFSSVARRSDPIELWDHFYKISKKKGIIKLFYVSCQSLNKNIIKRDNA